MCSIYVYVLYSILCYVLVVNMLQLSRERHPYFLCKLQVQMLILPNTPIYHLYNNVKFQLPDLVIRLDWILFKTAHASMAFSGVCSRIKWGEENTITVTIHIEIQVDFGHCLSLSVVLLLCPSGLTANSCWYSSWIFSAWSGCGALSSFSTHQTQIFELRAG